MPADRQTCTSQYSAPLSMPPWSANAVEERWMHETGDCDYVYDRPSATRVGVLRSTHGRLNNTWRDAARPTPQSPAAAAAAENDVTAASTCRKRAPSAVMRWRQRQTSSYPWRRARQALRPAFHDTDIDILATILVCVVGVGVVECGLNRAPLSSRFTLISASLLHPHN